MSLVPKDDYVIIKREDSERQTKGGLVIPDIAKRNKGVGIIVALPGAGSEDLNIGDKVIFSVFAEIEVNFEDQDLLFLNVNEIHAKITNEINGQGKCKTRSKTIN